jgi:hypothetical protein
MGKLVAPGKLDITFHLNKPSVLLRTAQKMLKGDHLLKESEMSQYINTVLQKAESLRTKDVGVDFSFPGWQNDLLFKKTYSHVGGDNCFQCNPQETEERQLRKSDYPVIHYSLIGSSDEVIKTTEFRNNIRDQYGVMCFEMEAAGLMDNFPCLIIRGICDYSDDHKNKGWQPYAAVAAAAYAKDLIRIIQPEAVQQQDLLKEVIEECKLLYVSDNKAKY